MSDEEAFRDLIRRVRAGDEQASAELVRQFESAIRIAAHVRQTDPALRRFFDSEDIRQSVLASFFVRAGLGQFELETPEQLMKLWTVMARNKIANLTQKHQAARRDHRRVAQGGLDDRDVADSSPGPSTLVANQELLEAARRLLSPDEHWLAEQRALNRPWNDIAAECGENPNALRMRLDRALDRVARQLGLET